jgi:hypothetical protein
MNEGWKVGERMRASRRDFMKSLAITLASLAMARCNPSQTTASSPKDRVLDCWLRLDWLAQETRNAGLMKGEKSEVQKQLLLEHEQALSEWVSTGELDRQVSYAMQNAFIEATIYVQNLSAVTVTCYESMSAEVLDQMHAEQKVESVQADLVRQAELLQAYSGTIDPSTLATAQQAIALDMTFLSAISGSFEIETYFQQYETGGMVLDPITLDAARLLAEILRSDGS